MSGEDWETISTDDICGVESDVKTVRLTPPNSKFHVPIPYWALLKHGSDPFWMLEKLDKSSFPIMRLTLKVHDVEKCENALKKVSRKHPVFFGPDKAIGGNLKISMMFVNYAALVWNVMGVKNAETFYKQGEKLAKLLREEIANANHGDEDTVECKNSKETNQKVSYSNVF